MFISPGREHSEKPIVGQNIGYKSMDSEVPQNYIDFISVSSWMCE